MKLNEKIAGSFYELKSTRNLVFMALIVALYVVISCLSTFLSSYIRISFTYIPVALASAMFGPVCGGVVGVLGDVFAFVVSPSSGGSYFPGFTLNAFIGGFIYGIFFYKNDITVMRVVCAKLLIFLIVQLGLTPLWLSIMYGKSYIALVSFRIFKNLIFIPIDTLVIMLVVKRVYGYLILFRTKEG